MLGKGDSFVDRSLIFINIVLIQFIFLFFYEGCVENGCEFVEDLLFFYKDVLKKV